MLLTALVIALAIQTPDPVLSEWQAAVVAAEASGDMEAVIGRLVGTEDRVVLCTLDGAVTRMRCFHSTQRTIDGVDVTIFSQTVEYDGQALAVILAAERAWVNGTP